jgi:5-methylcytosine-specific restriction endonuclease McrA
MKRCKKCKTEKAITEFYKNHTYLDGRDSTCKSCNRAYQKKWREQNRIKHRTYSKAYYAEHKEERSAYYADWRVRNLESINKYNKQWRIDNPERMRARRKLDNARRRALLENAKGDFTVDEWLELKESYGNTCLACGRSEPEVKITPDHVIPLSKGGSNSIENIQPLCWGCNAGKQARIKDYRAEDGYQLPEVA